MTRQIPSNPNDTANNDNFASSNAILSDNHTPSDVIVAKLLQGYRSKKTLSKGKMERPLDKIKASIFNPCNFFYHFVYVNICLY